MIDSIIVCPPPSPKIAPMDMIIAVGFGYAGVHKDGETIYQEDYNDEEFKILQEFEDMAKADPDHKWEVVLSAPLKSSKYERNAQGQWILVEEGEGFA